MGAHGAMSRAGVRSVALVAAIVAASFWAVTPLAHADAPSNDNKADATVVGALAFDADVDLSQATVEVGERDCYGWSTDAAPATNTSAPGSIAHPANPLALGLKASSSDPSQSTTNTVWYSYSPSEDVRIDLDTLGSEAGQDTVLAVYQTSKWGDYTVTCSDDAEGGLASRVVFDAWAGQTYLIQLGAFRGGATSARLHMQVAPPRGTISGTVISDATGNALADICVNIIGSSSWGWAQTDAAGAYAALADPGEVRVAFYDCSWDWGRDWYFGDEYYDDAAELSDAVVLNVESDVEIPGIDAGLAVVPYSQWGGADMAITALEIEHVMPRIDGAVAPIGPGTSRLVHVELANLGTSSGSGAVNVEICPVTTRNRCTLFDTQLLHLAGGSSQDVVFDWNGLGTVGDVTVRAYVDTCGYWETWDNNEMTRRDYVTVGGTGVGVSARGGSGLSRSYVSSGCTYAVHIGSPPT